MSSTHRQDGSAGKPVQLTSRQKNIIQILTKFTASRPATVGMISEMLGLSSRTILREMPQVERWLTQNDFHFVRKPGVGLILDENVENQKLILELLESESIQRNYSKEERRRCILGELLYAQQPLKSYYFTSRFHISEGTLSNDLDEVGRWLKTYHIELLRRPGLGILLEGDEGSYRQAIANVVYESIDESQIMQLLCGEPPDTGGTVAVHNRVFNLLDHEMTVAVEQILLECEQRLHIRYTDSAYVGLIVHIALAIKRIQNNEKIEMEREKMQKLMMMPEFSVAEEICDRLKDAFQIRIPRGEVGFITMHLSSARIWPTDERAERSIDSVYLHQLVRQMIDSVQQELHVDLSDSEGLLEDLYNHMAPMLSRLTTGIHIENSQLETVRQEYPEIMQATRHACAMLPQETGLRDVPDSELAFLAMHFGAAIEKAKQQQQTISVVVVCPTGIGTSRILEAGLTREFANIHVCGAISAFHIDTDKLRTQGIDLIISTVSLSTEFPWICVSPILQLQDKRRIETMLASLPQPARFTQVMQYRRQMTLSDIRDIVYTGRELLDLFANIKFDVVHTVHTRAEVIARAGSLFAADDRAAAHIEAGLYERDQIMDTYVKQFHALMLHCQTQMVNHARFGYIKLEPPLYERGRVILGAMVMLVPDRHDDTVPHRLIGAIGALLVENKTLLDLLRIGEWDKSLTCIEEGLGVYYKQFLKKRIGVGEK